jgi:hypothetical protein
MQRDTLAMQVVLESQVKVPHVVSGEMKQLAHKNGYSHSTYRGWHHLVKFVPYVDEQDEEDAEMIEHNFYF